MKTKTMCKLKIWFLGEIEIQTGSKFVEVGIFLLLASVSVYLIADAFI